MTGRTAFEQNLRIAEPEEILAGFATIRAPASSAEQCIPGLDPLKQQLYPEAAPDVFRLDVEPLARLYGKRQLR